MILLLAVYGVLGAFVGLLAGLLGIGGGTVIVPMLLYAFGWQGIDPEIAMHLALGTSMGTIVFTSISSTLAHHRHGCVEWNIIKYIAPGLVLGTFLGSLIAVHIPAHWLQRLFVVFLFYVSIQMVAGKKPKASRQLPGSLGLAAAGTGIGSFSSLVGIGGGVLVIPYMIWHNVPMRHAIGTSAAVGGITAFSGTTGYLVSGFDAPGLPEYSTGFLYLPALFGIVIVSVLTVSFGVRLAQHLPVPALKKIFALMLFTIACRMTFNVF